MLSIGLSGLTMTIWQMVRVYKDERSMNDSGTNRGGWDASDMRRWLNTEFLELCSDELQSVIRPVVKLTSAGGESK